MPSSRKFTTVNEAKLLAADSMRWIEELRNCSSVADFNVKFARISGLLKSRHACQQIVDHYAIIAFEERARLSERGPAVDPARGKMFAAGDA